MPERVCSVCGASFTWDPASFAGLAPPRVCRSCHYKRRSRLSEAQGRIVQVRKVGALLEIEDGRRFFWTWSSSRTEPPCRGEHFRFVFDPQERPDPPRLPVARGVRPLAEASGA